MPRNNADFEESKDAQSADKPWSYTHHMTAREIVENYKFHDGGAEQTVGEGGPSVVEWKAREAFNEPLPYYGSDPADESTWKKPDWSGAPKEASEAAPGWYGKLGSLIEKNGYQDNYSSQPHIVEDHPVHGRVLLDGQHRVAAMYKLHPDQLIRVTRSNWAAADDVANKIIKHNDEVRERSREQGNE